MGAYKYMQELYRKKQSDVLRFLLRVRCWQYRQLTKMHRAPRPSRPDKARRLGYKAKQGNTLICFSKIFSIFSIMVVLIERKTIRFWLKKFLENYIQIFFLWWIVHAPLLRNRGDMYRLITINNFVYLFFVTNQCTWINTFCSLIPQASLSSEFEYAVEDVNVPYPKAQLSASQKATVSTSWSPRVNCSQLPR